MKFFSTLFSTLSLLVLSVLAASVRKPGPKYFAAALAHFDFKFDPTKQANLKTESVTVGLQKIPVTDKLDLIPLGVVKGDTDFGAKIRLPHTVPGGKYYLIAVENLVGDVEGGETFHMYNQSFTVW